MTLDEGDKAIVHDIARLVAAEMKKELKACISTSVDTHILSCPWGRKVGRFLWMATGAGVVLGVLGLATVPQVVAFLKNAMGAVP